MAFRRKMTEAERKEFDATLEKARRRAKTVLRDGREFTLVKLPDRYGKAGPTGGKHWKPSSLDTLDEGN